ncbi:hypothetical protein [Mycolicibacterium mageritense]|uniref:hypothetical protein n=1 Tax=Mycolicibacterium mageritense TaxID=53462 RepID=UPI0011D9A5BB|nr:hypothetical protein [Mycolicibacterium mageritense]TXI62930.1 MAG: hypothetical protein E6Q55_11260 [Mycolicibacterium mageritense]
MRVRFGYTVEVSDDQRRIIAAYNDDDHDGLDDAAGRRATHSEVADFFSALGYDNGIGVMNDFIGESRY